MSEDIYRSVKIDSIGEDRTITGVVVPWDEVATVDDPVHGTIKERFERGSFAPFDPENPPLLYANHDHQALGMHVGEIIDSYDDDRGQIIRAKIYETSKGNDVYWMAKNGKLPSFSVGAHPLGDRWDGDVLVRTKVDMFEASLVKRGAYKKASVEIVREETENTTKKEEIQMETNEREDILRRLDEQSSAIEDVNRKVSVLSVAPEAPAGPIFRTAGDWIKGLYKSDEKAHELYRVFTGATTADSVVKDAWVQEAILQVAQNRPVVNAFSRTALPATGMAVEYAVLEGTTGSVEEQAAEGDDLTYTEVNLGTDTAPVVTLGAYASLSRQTIERSTVNVLNESYEFMLNEYARKTDAFVRDAIEGGTYVSVGALPTTSKTEWITWFVNAAAEIKDATGLTLDTFLCSKDVFIDLVTLDDAAGGSFLSFNKGSANPVGLSATLFNGVEAVVDLAASDNTAYAASSQAVRFYESGNAPVRLQDANIINLTQDVSIHGLVAVAIRVPDAIVSHDAEASG